VGRKECGKGGERGGGVYNVEKKRVVAGI